MKRKNLKIKSSTIFVYKAKKITKTPVEDTTYTATSSTGIII